MLSEKHSKKRNMNEMVSNIMNPEFNRISLEVLMLEVLFIDLNPCGMLDEAECDKILDEFYFAN